MKYVALKQKQGARFPKRPVHTFESSLDLDDVETVEVHDLGPCSDKVMDELFLRII